MTTLSSCMVSAMDDLRWMKSSYSAADQDCVEVACTGEGDLFVAHVRDSKDPEGPKLTFTRGEWDAFVAGAQAGEFDL